MNFNRGAHHQTQACFYSVNPLYFDNNPALGIMVILRKYYSFFSFKFMVMSLEPRFEFVPYKSTFDPNVVLQSHVADGHCSGRKQNCTAAESML